MTDHDLMRECAWEASKKKNPHVPHIKKVWAELKSKSRAGVVYIHHVPLYING